MDADISNDAFGQFQFNNIKSETTLTAAGLSVEPNFDSADNVNQETCTLDDILAVDSTTDNCLLINKVYQELITETLNRLQIQLEENLQQQQYLRVLLEESSTSKGPGNVLGLRKFKHTTVFCQPYFKNKAGFPQPGNEDTQSKFANQYYDLYSRNSKKWSCAEHDLLKNAVKSSALEQMLQPLMVRQQLLTEKLTASNNDCDEKVAIEKKIEECLQEIEKIKSSNNETLFGDIDKEHDWLSISSVNFEGKRTPIECQLMWQNFLHPFINQSKWSANEDMKLKDAVSKFEFRDWDGIAKELNTNRTALQCIERFQRQFNESITKSMWTAEEDAALFDTIESCRIGNFIPWHQVSYYMEGRTKEQVYRRWTYNVNPNLKHGKWTETEDLILLAAVARYGPKWKKICSHIAGRTNTQCRDRYLNSLDTSVVCQGWTPEEDMKLAKLVQSKGAKWAEIATFFPGRTDSMVAKRYSRIELAIQNDQCEENAPTDLRFHPKTIVRKRLYRQCIYQKLMINLGILSINGEAESNQLSLDYLVSLLKDVEKTELDTLIEKLKRKLSNREQRPKVTNFSKIRQCDKTDEKFEQYFASLRMFNNIRVGRPNLNDLATIGNCDKNCITATVALLQVLGSEVRISSSVLGTLQLSEHVLSTVVTKSAILPPTLTSLILYKQLSTLDELCPSKNVVKSKNEKRTSTVCRIVNKPSDNTSNDLGTKSTINEWTVLAKRFINLFFWPALLSQVSPLNEKLDLGISLKNEKKEKKEKNCKKSSFETNKRKSKKPWVSERMRLLAQQRWQSKTKEEKKCQPSDNPQPTQSDNHETKPQNDSENNDTQGKRKRGRPVGSVNKKVKLEVPINVPIRKSSRIVKNKSLN